MQIAGHFTIGQNRIDNESVGDDGAEEHSENIHQNHTGEVIQIKLECAHTVFNMLADQIEEVKEKQVNETATGLGEHISEQPPNLTLQNLGLIKTQKFVKNNATVDHRHHDNKSVAKGDIEHQIGNALVPVAEAKAFKSSPQIIQSDQLLT